MRSVPLYRQSGHMSGGVIRANFYIVTHSIGLQRGLASQLIYHLQDWASHLHIQTPVLNLGASVCYEHDENGGGRGARIQLNTPEIPQLTV